MNAVDDIVLCALNHPGALDRLKQAASSAARGHRHSAAGGFFRAASSAALLSPPDAARAGALDILRAAAKLAETCDAAWLAENTEGA